MNKNSSGQSLYNKIIARRVFMLLLMGLLLILLSGYAITLGVAEISLTQVYGVIFSVIPGINFIDSSSYIEGIVLNISYPGYCWV
ncbi:MAG: hypothetical protein ACOC2G_00475 [Bacillota bacterium]